MYFCVFIIVLFGIVGIGNILGVVFVIFFGGFVVLFWMWVIVFLGMIIKFVEVILLYKYCVKIEDGIMVGGFMYYMDCCLNMKWLVVVFVVVMVVSLFGIGNFF